MRMILRLARPEDFDYCARLYFEEVEKELNLNMDAQVAGLRQLFVDGALRRRGIGTEGGESVDRGGSESRSGDGPRVVKTNPALRLYERLVFCTTHQDERKFYMRRD